MHDINKIRNNADFFIKGWKRRGLDVNLDTILALDKDLRKSITDLQELQTQRNDLSKKFGIAKKNNDKVVYEKLSADVQLIKEKMQSLEEGKEEFSKSLNKELSSLPNIPLDEIPDGKDESSNKIINEYGVKKDASPNHYEIGEELGTKGNEFGTVTSRKRRCGWFDGVLVRQTIKISGINGIALTKLDVLDDLDHVKMCVAYELDGNKIDYLPAAVDDQLKVKPIYKSFEGWKTSTKGIKNFKDLPENAKKYIRELEQFIETKVSSISTSPERNDTILIVDPFKN